MGNSEIRILNERGSGIIKVLDMRYNTINMIIIYRSPGHILSSSLERALFQDHREYSVSE